MGVIGALYSHWTLQLAIALSASAYNLAESSVTTSHRDYAMVYICWALALLPDRFAEGAAFGICIHLLASSGFAKLVVGGREWLHPGTMRSILSTYYGKLP